MSSASENSTEPWFCDACKCGVSPSCELCPNQDGIFKETDAGRLMSHYVVFICLLDNMPGLELPFLPFMTFESHTFAPSCELTNRLQMDEGNTKDDLSSSWICFFFLIHLPSYF